MLFHNFAITSISYSKTLSCPSVCLCIYKKKKKKKKKKNGTVLTWGRFDLHFWDVGPFWPIYGAILTKGGPFWLGAVLTVIRSNEYPQSLFASRNKKNNVYPYKPQFYYIKVGFKGVNII